MRAVAICLTYGRAEVCDLLACWARQSVSVPLLLWFDGPAPVLGELPANTYVHHARRSPDRESIGPVRAEAVELARARYQLSPDDAFVVLDDDDYYHPQHAELTLSTLRNAHWTGARRLGLQRQPGSAPTLLESHGGPGQHATWAMRLGIYDAAGGYNSARMEDVDLGQRVGWRNCVSHDWCTHVRREFGVGLSVDFDRDALRARSRLAPVVTHRAASDELDTLARWCTLHLSQW